MSEKSQQNKMKLQLFIYLFIFNVLQKRLFQWIVYNFSCCQKISKNVKCFSNNIYFKGLKGILAII